MGSIVVITENATEPVRNVVFAMKTRRVIDRLPRCDRHADHPLFRLCRECEKSLSGLFISNGVGGI